MGNPSPHDPPWAKERDALLRRLEILHRADLILHNTEDLDLLHQRFLDLMMEAAQVEAGTLYLVDDDRDELVFAVVRGPGGVDRSLQGRRMPMGWGIAGHAAERGERIWVPQVEQSRLWARDLAERSGYRPSNVLCLPLKVQDRVIGVVQLFNHLHDLPYTEEELSFLSVLVNDLALKVQNARLLDDSREMVARLRALLDLGMELGMTLDRNRILHMILDRIHVLLQAEAASVFELLDEEKVLVLCASSPVPPEDLGTIRVPCGEGIAGWVAQHGETVLVPDVRQDPRFYAKADDQTRFVTRSLACTPLAIQEQIPGQEGVYRRRIIGVAQVLNKKDGGEFTPSDMEMFEGLARQAAIAMQRTRLYQEISDLFTSAIMALTEAMDAKDPYTEGHTRRVTVYSVGIAEQMELPAEDVLKIRTAALLHDIGKIGMPDAILRKAGRVTEAEMEVIRRHPLEGERILRPLQYLHEIIPGVAEHHERYDGKGYPRGLIAEEISLYGRIIAVADTFDAMTSDRSYRRALSTEVALGELRINAGTQFDPQVVDTFIQAWEQQRMSVDSPLPQVAQFPS